METESERENRIREARRQAIREKERAFEEAADAEEEEARKRLANRVRKENKRMKSRVRRTKKARKLLIVLLAAFLVLFGLREFISYTTIPKLAQLRDMYIATAMTTNSHQWLATLFFPKSVIKKVTDALDQQNADQESLASSWDSDRDEAADQVIDDADSFYEVYWELDSPTFRAYLKKHPELVEDGYDKIYIKDLDHELDLYTKQGDPLLALDAANNLMIVGIDHGVDYQGKMALVKDPSQVEHVLAKYFGSTGQEISSFGEKNDALVAINADPFEDPEGHGGGGTVLGSCIVDGVEYGSYRGYRFYGMDYDNHFYVENYSNLDVSDWRWGLEFFPAMIVDGENVVGESSSGTSLQPRTCIGQEEDGTFIMMIVDGRQPLYSIGATVSQCTDIMESYNVYQAGNLDGGSSAVMWYDGELITKSSSASGVGRYCPDALIINKVSNED